MKKMILSAMLLSSALMFSACNTNKTEDSTEVAEEQNEQKLDSTDMDDDAEFAVAAADGGLMEVKLGELAQTNAADPKVKEFGKNMITDHGKAGEELHAAATKKNITLPTGLSDEKQKKYDELAAKKGAEFDKAYVSFMVDDHKDDISEFEKAAKECKDPDLKTWAEGKLPTLRHHLEMAQSLDETKK
ncbi:DUF4142 domain-containing protein [Dyadobacter sandarakinus]|uniref:DUF4142 domain-containing protein n=1 Tax=Dyadobacter sandarakinus TaxID=2747268 RepID=A0ABX7I7Q8_9BACT|nr:DUF4142 domain-containing protein [Dyadobacter sandarakinus]QRR02124.1 DUF4142 domain-containing protein [Dyadobacter sandarakinus]